MSESEWDVHHVFQFGVARVDVLKFFIPLKSLVIVLKSTEE
jgi:hypothetical protein